MNSVFLWARAGQLLGHLQEIHEETVTLYQLGDGFAYWGLRDGMWRRYRTVTAEELSENGWRLEELAQAIVDEWREHGL